MKLTDKKPACRTDVYFTPQKVIDRNFLTKSQHLDLISRPKRYRAKPSYASDDRSSTMWQQWVNPHRDVSAPGPIRRYRSGRYLIIIYASGFSNPFPPGRESLDGGGTAIPEGFPKIKMSFLNPAGENPFLKKIDIYICVCVSKLMGNVG